MFVQLRVTQETLTDVVKKQQQQQQQSITAPQIRDMTDRKTLMRLLLLLSLLRKGVRAAERTVFVSSRLGGVAHLPCAHLLSPDCSSVSWTFYKGGKVRYSEEVSGGRVRADSDKSSRMSVTSGCSLGLRDLKVDDAGSYICLQGGKSVTHVYLSLLTITSPSVLTDLQPGGNLTLHCVLFSYYDAGSCKSYSSSFKVSWAAEDGTPLPGDSRYELIVHSPCHITLVTTLQQEDNNRKWRCQVNNTESSGAAYLLFTSAFLFDDRPAARPPPVAVDCAVQLPVSRIVLCAALPVMVLVVGLFTWRGDRRRAKMSAGGIELQEVK